MNVHAPEAAVVGLVGHPLPGPYPYGAYLPFRPVTVPS